MPVPLDVARSPITPDPLMDAAVWAVGQRELGLSEEAAHDVTRAIVDWFAATIAGHDAEPVRILHAVLDTEQPTGAAELVPNGKRVPARAAALVNGTAAHAAELDDIYREGLFHPGAATVAAALAVAQAGSRNGRELFAAVGAGIEISTRVAAALQPEHYRHWHTTGTVGPIGAAVAAAVLAGGNSAAVAHATATAPTFAGGLQAAMRHGSMLKPLHAGRAAEAGVLAGLTCAHGLRSTLDVLDGFGAAVAGAPDWTTTFQDLDTVRQSGSLSIKAHACCGHIFAAIDAALGLRADESFDPGGVEAIEVSSYEATSRVAGKTDPRTRHEAQFSTAFCVATALTHGEVTLASLTPDQQTSAPVHDLAARVRLVVDPTFEAAYPSKRGARVRITLRDGKTLERVAPTRRGDPDAPLSDDELRQKFDTYVGPVLGLDRTHRLARRLWSLSGDVTTLGCLFDEQGAQR